MEKYIWPENIIHIAYIFLFWCLPRIRTKWKGLHTSRTLLLRTVSTFPYYIKYG